MNFTDHIPLHKKFQLDRKFPPKNDQANDQSDDYRWRASFDFKKNINKMYYTNLSDRYELKDLLDKGYNEVDKIVEYLETPANDMNNSTLKKKYVKQNLKKDNPRIFSLMKKYKKLLTNEYFQKQVPHHLYQQKQKKLSNQQKLTFQYAKQQILKEYSELNNEQLTKHFSDLVTNHYLFSFMQGQEVLFQEIVRNISPRMNYNVYLPSMLKVIMANVNWIDRENDTASLSLKIQVKVNVPGIFQYPYFYEQVFKEKMRISFKTENKSNTFNQKIQFNGKNEAQTIEIKKDKIIKNQTKSKYHSDCGKFFQTGYKWLNYDKPTYIYHKRVEEFQGFIVEATISDIRVLASNENQMSPFQMIDLYGIVQLEPIVTEMKDWVQILFEKDDASSMKSLKKFLIEASPQVTIKFNLISLYQNKYDLQNDEKISLNHIRSFDAVECDGYKLSQNLMFLETSNQRKSRYQLCKFSKCRTSYKWYIKDKSDVSQQIKNKMNNFSLKKQEIQYKNYGQSDAEILYKYLKIDDFQFCINKKTLQTNNTQNLIQINKRFQNKFRQIRVEIYNLFSQDKVLEDKVKKIYIMNQKQQNQTYYPENLIYEKIQKYLPLLKSMQQANLANQIYINSQIDQEYHQKLKKNLSQEIYKFAGLKYKFQNYYRRILEILISQFEDQKGLYFQSQYQYLKGKQKLQELKERLKEVIYNHDCQNFGQNLANVKTDQEYHYPKAIYHFPFYKNPTATLVLLFSSPFVLCVINLFIFFQQAALNDRLASTTALMICFIGMVAIMQKQMHSSTMSTFEFLIYAMMLTPLLCLASSLHCYLNKIEPNWDYVMHNPLFWISVLISALGLLIPSIFLVIYKCIEQNIYSKNLNVQKQMQPLFLLFPGSTQVDRIIKKQQDIEQEQLDEDFNVNNKKKQGTRKTLQRVVTSLMFKHLDNLYQLRKQIPERQPKLTYALHKSIKQQKKFIKSTFDIPKFDKNKSNIDGLQSSTQIWDSPIKQRKNKLSHQQIMEGMFKYAYSLRN